MAALEEAPATSALMRRVRQKFWASPAAVTGSLLLVVVLLAAALAPWVAPHDPWYQDMDKRLLPPAWDPRGDPSHLLGTDQLGRDLLSRVIYGSRVSLLVGITSVAISGSLGVTLGLLSGYYGGAVDAVIMRIADVQLAFPFILLAITFIAVLGSHLLNLVLVLGFAGWVNYARLVRGEVLSHREREYVEAARALGASDSRIIFRHLLPNLLSSVVVLGTLQVAFVILAESGLTFLGLGVAPTTPTWGRLLHEGRTYMAMAWWVATFPGLAIMVTVLGSNLLGDWLRDVLDVKLRN